MSCPKGIVIGCAGIIKLGRYAGEGRYTDLQPREDVKGMTEERDSLKVSILSMPNGLPVNLNVGRRIPPSVCFL